MSTLKGARVHDAGTQSIPTDTMTAVNLDSERRDDDTYHDTVTNNTRLSITTAAWYIIGAHVQWPANSTGIRAIDIYKNGTTVVGRSVKFNSGAFGVSWHTVTTAVFLDVGDYIEMRVGHNRGSALSTNEQDAVSPEFWLLEMPAVNITPSGGGKSGGGGKPPKTPKPPKPPGTSKPPKGSKKNRRRYSALYRIDG